MVAWQLTPTCCSGETGHHLFKKVSHGGPPAHFSQPISRNGLPSLQESLSWWPGSSSQPANQRKWATISPRKSLMVARLLIPICQPAQTGHHPFKISLLGGPAPQGHPPGPRGGRGQSLVARPLISTSPPPSSQFAKISAKAPKMTACRTSSQSSRRVETHFCNPSPKKIPLCPESFHRESYFLLYMSEGTISLLHMIIK